MSLPVETGSDPLLEELALTLAPGTPQPFGRYEIRELVGEGSFGRVYRAFDPSTQREVAIKVLRPSVLTAQAGDCERRCQREAQAVGGLSHPNIVMVYDVAEEYLVMEFLRGLTLRALLDTNGRLDLAHTVALLRPMAKALDYAHRKGIVHRDIKPANVMILPDGRPKLMDFGVAHLVALPVTYAGECVGSPSYMAPEQIVGQSVGAPSDIFSLTAIAYEMLTGSKAFNAENPFAVMNRVLNQEPAAASQLVPGLPAHCDAALARGLHKDPSARFATAIELVTALAAPPLLAVIRKAVRIPAILAPRPPPMETQDLRGLSGVRPIAKRPPSRRLALASFVTLIAFLLPVAASAPTRLGLPVAANAEPLTGPLAVGSDPASAIGTPLAQAGVPPGMAHQRLPPPEEPMRRARMRRPAPIPTPAAPVAPRMAIPPPPVEAPAGLAEADVTPHRIAGRTPIYPDSLLAKGVQGRVVVEMTVTETGEPVDVRVLESPDILLTQAVTDAVRTWRFEPVRRDGVPVRVRWTVIERFDVR